MRRHFRPSAETLYFYPERVWVYGFDSAASRELATGKIKEDELASFHLEYERLSRQKEFQFEDAFKIVIVHHHPLPVNWQTDWKQQFLTMINSGSFLASMLTAEVRI